MKKIINVDSKTLITSAITEELAGILKKVKKVKKKKVRKTLVYEGVLNDTPVILLKTGVGREFAAKSLSVVLDNIKVDRLISIGFAGGVSYDLSVPDLVFCESTECFNDDRKIFKPDKYLFEKALAHFKNSESGSFYCGKCVTVDEIIYTPSKKKEVGKKYNAMIVEMENFAICEEAQKRNIPYLLVRSVSDTITDDLSFLKGLNGNFSKPKVAFYALRHPEILPGLNRLRVNSTLAEKRLSEFIYGFIREI